MDVPPFLYFGFLLLKHILGIVGGGLIVGFLVVGTYRTQKKRLLSAIQTKETVTSSSFVILYLYDRL